MSYVHDPKGPYKPRVKYTGARKSNAPDASKKYHPEEIIGRCSECSVICTLEFPPGTFNWNDGDRIMEYYSVNNVKCLNCKRMVQFKPIDMRNPTDRDLKELSIIYKAQGKLLKGL